MKVLVTGGEGFIGRHTVDRLRELEHKVTIFDRFAKKLWRNDVDFYLGDVRDSEAVSDAVSKHDGVINLAGILGTSEMVTTPRESIEVNVYGAINVYEACKRFGCKAVQITVGNWSWNNSYAITKYCSERFALMYNKEFGTRIAVVRGLNVYGEWQMHKPIKKVVPNFVLSALKGEPIVIYGDGEQLLDMIYVKDTAEILARALTVEHGVYDRVIEAGSGELVTVNELAKMIIEFAGSKSELVHKPMRSGEPEKSVTRGDPQTCKPLGYVPNTPLREGLKKTVDWYRKNYEPYLEWAAQTQKMKIAK